MKFCTKCNKNLPLEEYSKKSVWCKTCSAQYQKDYRAKLKLNVKPYIDYKNVQHVNKKNNDSMEHPNFKKCWALENLQPLETVLNIKKSNK